MRIAPLLAVVAAAALALGACSSSSSTTAPTAAPASAAPSSGPGGTVALSIKDFAFNPAAISASVGQTVSFTNDDSAPHTATLDDGSCTTPSLSKGLAAGLTFSAAGTYPFH